MEDPEAERVEVERVPKVSDEMLVALRDWADFKPGGNPADMSPIPVK